MGLLLLMRSPINSATQAQQPSLYRKTIICLDMWCWIDYSRCVDCELKLAPDDGQGSRRGRNSGENRTAYGGVALRNLTGIGISYPPIEIERVWAIMALGRLSKSRSTFKELGARRIDNGVVTLGFGGARWVLKSNTKMLADAEAEAHYAGQSVDCEQGSPRVSRCIDAKKLQSFIGQRFM